MKKIIIVGAIMAMISGCASNASVQDKEPPKLGMANPASTYCVEQGGKLEIRKETGGEVGYCHLADGRVIEEWEFFRMNQPRCLADEAKALIGQAEMSEAKIKEKTKATDVRIVAPNQPVTMDYREDRVTVVVENGKIIRASCG